MTNILRVELDDCNQQFEDKLNPKQWRNFSNLGENFEIPVASENEKKCCLASVFEWFLKQSNSCDTVQENIDLHQKSENLIECKSCKTFWPTKKIKCEKCKLNIRSQTVQSDAKSTRIEPQSNKTKTMKLHCMFP